MTAQILTFKPREDGTVTTQAKRKVDHVTEAGVFQAIRRRQELDKKLLELDQEPIGWHQMFSDDYPFHK
jgi:hypothetical protein